MAKYRIYDTLTGKTVTVEGDTAPTEAEAQQIFGDAGLRSEQPQQEQEKPKTGTETNWLADKVENIPLLGGMLHSAVTGAQDVGTGIRNMIEQPDLQKNEELASQLEQQAMATTDMAQRKSLLQQANQIRSGVSNRAQDISRSFTNEVGQNNAWRALKGATSIATTADLAAQLPTMALKRLGVNTAIGPKLMSSTPVLGTTQLGPGSNLLQRGAVHAAHGFGEGSLVGIGQGGENPDMGQIGAYGAGGAVLEPLLAALFSGLLTKSGVGKKLGKAYQTADEAGSQITKNDIITEAQKNLKSKSAKKMVKKIINDYEADIIEKLPGQQISEAYSPTEAWGVAKDISKSRGPSIFDYFTGPSTEKQSSQALRRAISSLLQDTAPDAKFYNQLYSMYSTGGPAGKLLGPIGGKIFGGSPAEVAGKLVITPLIWKAITALLSGGGTDNTPSSYSLNRVGQMANYMP